ncbi:MAG: dehydrogenase [Rickettsiales bacterium]|nr:dehydrogenase [Rickettsiales bacterium]|tara:strand:+ start:140 stop:1111 length:972 start_codon:yes stop_codon:yes gene_type:complete
MTWWNRILDKSILFSFDRSGYQRHERAFLSGSLDVSMEGRSCLVSGANSGLGFELARGLAARGAAVHMLCRNPQRGAQAKQAIQAEHSAAQLQLHIVDLSSLASIRSFVAGFEINRVDVLLHNAGLLPLRRELTADGLELTVATHLVGPFLLTRLLAEKLAGGRVVFVSSGGMYAKRLDVEAMLRNEGSYDGVAAYAMTKRAQVVLAELLAEQLKQRNITVNSMHPGWAATPGVERSLPRFWTVMGKRLRTPAQGADTALWLAVAAEVEGLSGRFWFDREVVSPYLFPGTREDELERRRLWALCERLAGGFTSAASEPSDSEP